jgi:hypothetical protein
MADHRSFAACAEDLSMLGRIEGALEHMFRTDYHYNKVGAAARCLLPLHPEDFPKEIQDEIAILYSVFQFMEHSQHNDYIGYEKIPLSISRQWFPTLLKIYGILMFANGAASVLPRTEIAKIDDACSKNMDCFFPAKKKGARWLSGIVRRYSRSRRSVMVFDPGAGGHAFDLNTKKCTKCGMTREAYEERGNRLCTGRRRDDQPLFIPDDPLEGF